MFLFSLPLTRRSYVVPTSSHGALASVYTVRYESGARLAMEVQIGSPTSRQAVRCVLHSELGVTLNWT